MEFPVNNPMPSRRALLPLLPTLLLIGPVGATPQDDPHLFLDNGTLRVGLDRTKGGSITWLSWKNHPKNTVNLHDPGRLLQQSYYAGRSLDRRADGQHKAWSPWTWNPIQGGGVESWARVTTFEKEEGSLHAVTVPKLWDMPNEEAQALMKQWVRFEPGMSNVLVVRNELVCQRSDDDRWGPAVPRHQEVPACYFTRTFDTLLSYLGDGQWREESAPLGPPWTKAQPPRRAMACFNKDGQGIAIFSPVSGDTWNFGPVGARLTPDPKAAPCVHVAPLTTAALGPRSTFRYRYWLVTGTKEEIAKRLEALWTSYADEKAALQVEPKTHRP